MYLEEDEVVDPTNLCSIVRHEYGHWLGFGHEDAELAAMPGCVAGSTEASGGVYMAPDPRVVARQQAWELWREWRRGCYEEETPRARHVCFRGLRRYAERTRKHFAV
jgi:hypothetical protein